MYLENRILKISDKFFKKKISRHPRNNKPNDLQINVNKFERTLRANKLKFDAKPNVSNAIETFFEVKTLKGQAKKSAGWMPWH